MSDLPPIVDVALVRPGDTVVLRYEQPLSDLEYDELSSRLDDMKQRLPELANIPFVIVDRCDGVEVFRPAPSEVPS